MISFDMLWPEIAIVSMIFAVGNITMGHFEEQTPKLRRLGKFVLILTVVPVISYSAGRVVAFSLLLGLFLPSFLYVHMYFLPKKKGINGFTGEPKRKYYEFRGWDTNIFDRHER